MWRIGNTRLFQVEGHLDLDLDRHRLAVLFARRERPLTKGADRFHIDRFGQPLGDRHVADSPILEYDAGQLDDPGDAGGARVRRVRRGYVLQHAWQDDAGTRLGHAGRVESRTSDGREGHFDLDAYRHWRTIFGAGREAPHFLRLDRLGIELRGERLSDLHITD